MAEERDRRGRRVTAERTGARRLMRAEGGRRHVITVRVSAAEFEAISARAIAARVSRQRLMVEAALARVDEAGQPTMTVSERRALVVEFLAVRRQVVGLATNINQIAAAANSGHPPDELAPALRAIQSTLARLDEAVDALTPPKR
ncbi:MAG UNVERIFIED_CONTAM: plasmid mobilization relaxosome protein MobC [Thermobifida fusca]